MACMDTNGNKSSAYAVWLGVTCRGQSHWKKGEYSNESRDDYAGIWIEVNRVL